MRLIYQFAIAGITYIMFAPSAEADDWPMGGRSASRNPVSLEKNAPTDWQFADEDKKARNIRWTTRVGSRAIGGPVIANGLVWVGTNNVDPLDPKIEGDYAVLTCFRETDGKFLYQYLSPRMKNVDPSKDWSCQSLSGSPFIEKDRLYFYTNRGEVVCLDIDQLYKKTGEPKVVWKLEMIKDFKVYPSKVMIPGADHCGSPASWKDYLYVPTGNGTGPEWLKTVSPEAPSLLCLRKDTGKVVWKDGSPGKNALYGHHSSPLVVEIKSVAQVIIPQSDGWVRSFEAETGKLLWKFDSNRKGTEWDFRGNDDDKAKTYVVSIPVFVDGRVYFSRGLEPEMCWGKGSVYCIDPTRRGDISAELDDGKGKGKPNPNSGVIWEFTGEGKDEKTRMHLSLGSIAVHDGLAIAADHEGWVHCLDAKTGKRHWVHDVKVRVFGSPLIVDGKFYVCTQERAWIFELHTTKKVIASHEQNRGIDTSPVYANGSLYVLTNGLLHSIGGEP
jgi:outer membrane protein assembly factor BamB